MIAFKGPKHATKLAESSVWSDKRLMKGDVMFGARDLGAISAEMSKGN